MEFLDYEKLSQDERQKTIWNSIFGYYVETKKGPKRIPGLFEQTHTYMRLSTILSGLILAKLAIPTAAWDAIMNVLSVAGSAAAAVLPH